MLLLSGNLLLLFIKLVIEILVSLLVINELLRELMVIFLFEAKPVKLLFLSKMLWIKFLFWVHILQK